MIITRSPLRITLGGGGTDIPSYYREHGGFCVAAAIDKYVYITLHETFEPGITLKYSKYEQVKSIDEIQHPIFREALRMVGIRDPHLEIASHADIPAGTGLGSSSAFTCALLKALYAYKGMTFDNEALAKLACELEIDVLGEPIGKQDQYISALGSIRALTFCPDGTVEDMVAKTALNFYIDLMLFFTGYVRSASEVLAAAGDTDWHAVKQAGFDMWRAFTLQESFKVGNAMDKQWSLKATSPEITAWREDAIAAKAAWSGKLVGAGGGGFLMFYKGSERLRAMMHAAGLKEVRFKFDYEGTKVI